MNFYELIKKVGDRPIKRSHWEFWAYPELQEYEGDDYLKIYSPLGYDSVEVCARDLFAEDWEVMDQEDFNRFFNKTKRAALCLDCMSFLVSWEDEEKTCSCSNCVSIRGGGDSFVVKAENMNRVRFADVEVKV